MRLVSGTIPLLSFHRERMISTASQLAIPLEADRVDVLLNGLPQTRNGDSGIVKVIFTAGVGGRGYHRPCELKPELKAHFFSYEVTPKLQKQHEQGISIGISNITLSGMEALAGTKHLNRLAQVWLAREIAEKGWDDALVLDQYQKVVELLNSNLFMVQQRTLTTPCLNKVGVKGVMRRYIMEQLAPGFGLHVAERPTGLFDLRQADEVFSCNSVTGITPVTQLGLWRWPVGQVTRQLQAHVKQLLCL